MAWSGSEFEELMPNVRAHTNMHSGLTLHVYYTLDRTYAQPNWQLGVLVRMYRGKYIYRSAFCFCVILLPARRVQYSVKACGEGVVWVGFSPYQSF